MDTDPAIRIAKTWAEFLGTAEDGRPVVLLAPPIVLSEAELVDLTGFKRRTLQLAELHRQGFYRARLGPAGQLILERAHYEAVCGGAIDKPRPKLRPVVRDPQPKWKVELK